MTMDAKDLRIESVLGAHNDDGNTKYPPSGTTFQPNGNKPYHDIGSNSLAKVDVPAARPCAIIGPDRVVPPQSTNDAYVKKVPVEPWQCTDSIYQHPPEYPHKPTEYQHSRNISPRQTFQENMQRIMVPPTFASVKNSEDHCLKNPKLMPLESKFCDVPYTISPINNEPKIVKSSDGLVLNSNYNQPVLPHGWPSSGVNVRPLRPYGAPDLYQYSEYANCPGPRPISMIRPHRNVHEEMPQVYQDRFPEANIRFKPYPTTKERPLQNPHSRYDYIPNYPNAFQPHMSYPPHKYELQKSIPTHPYSVYPPVPLKYLERRMPVPTMEKYPRTPNQQVNLSQSFCNQNMPPTYGPLPGNCLPNRAYPYAPDPASKNMIHNRLYFENNNSRKYYNSSENMFTGDINRSATVKSDLMYPPYPPINIQSLPPHHMYRKENPMKAYEHAIHYRNLEYSTNLNPMGRVPLQFSPQTMSISPSDSNTSNDTTQIVGSAQDDCGYVSQSSTASIRSVESGINRISNDIMYRRQDMTLPHVNKFVQKVDTNTSSKDKKSLDVRQFLQMWNEGDDEGNDSNKEPIKQRDSSNALNCYESGNNQEQLYVLGLVNVPKEELGKYDHIQKISKLPENIKGYNSIELLHQYEKLVESPGLNQFSLPPTQPKHKDLHVPIRNSFPRHAMEGSSASARPLSPLDVEAKISQSVIHKEVGCNFEIRPCSPQMMNVELATPVHNVLGERLIEKVVNPVQTKSPVYQRIEETKNISSSRSSPKVTSCKMVSNQYPSPHLNESLKTSYCLQDLESNSGVCLASLPRLDNDIELNFPEINQQFINDNKISSIRDLPILDTDNGGNANNSKSKIHNHFIIEQPTSGSDSEKDVSKLSKYRKQKKYSVPNEMDDTLNISLHRTDSVIIKNPENAKSQEECLNNIHINNSNTPGVENIANALNTIEESDKPINYSDKKSVGIIYDKSNDYMSTDTDTAIDFSLNKCDDMQSNNIKSLSKLNDSLKENNEIDNEIIYKDTGKVCNQDLANQVEITVTHNIAILGANSPTLGDITCPKVLDNKVVSQSTNEDTRGSHNHESVITHSKYKEIISLTDNIESHDDLPLLNHDHENLSANITESTSVVSENLSALSIDIENQAVNFSMIKHPDDVHLVCEPKSNLGEENFNSHNTVKDTYEGIPWSDKETQIETENNTVSQENLIGNDSKTLSEKEENNAINDKFEAKNIGILATKSENKDDTPNKLLRDISNLEMVNEISNQELPIIQDSNVDVQDNKVNACNEYSVLNHGEVTNISIDVDSISRPDCNDLIPISINDLVSTSVDCTKMDVENESVDSSSIITTNKEIPEVLTSELEISTPSVNENLDIQLLESNSEPNQIKYELTFIKKLYSPRIQNLLLYEEGSCTSVTTNENKDTNYFYENTHCLQPFEDLKDSDKSNCEELKTLSKNKITNHSIDIKDYETTKTFTSDNSIACGSDVEATLFDSTTDNITIAEPKLQQNDLIINNIKDQIDCESFLIQTYDSERVVNVPDEETDDTSTDNNIEIIDKKINHVDSEPMEEVPHKETFDRVADNNIEITDKKNNHVDKEPVDEVPYKETFDRIENNNIEMTDKKNNHVDSESLDNAPYKETFDKIADNNIEITDKTDDYVEEKSPLHLIRDQLPNKRRRTLKRSLSESAITSYTAAAINTKSNYDNNFKFSRKRAKIEDSEILVESDVLNENLTSFIQNNRRNSVSTIYNDDNVSFCILIENDCVLTQDNDSCQKICYTELPDECLTTICTEGDTDLTENVTYGDTAELFNENEVLDPELTADIYYEDNILICNKDDNDSEIDSEKKTYEEPEFFPDESDFLLQNTEDRTIEDTWVEDVACMETVFSDDIAEDIVISAPSSPKDSDIYEDKCGNAGFVYNINVNEHTNKVKHIYGHQMCDDDAELVEKLYRTPQMNVNQTLIDRESQLSQEYTRYYDNESLEKILSESNSVDTHPLVQNDANSDKSLSLPCANADIHSNKENLQDISKEERKQEIYSTVDLPDITETEVYQEKKFKKYDDCHVHSCESSCDNIVAFKKDEKLQYAISSSPEVSSTTSEEKGPAILLKIRSYKGSKISEVNDMSASFNHIHSHRPLITKAAQKYIPPLKETIHDLKVKIRLPKHSLYKLQQLKQSKEKPKIDTNCSKLYIKSLPQETLKKPKPKPKFEDVLKSIDEIQFKKHKIKNKKPKQSVPKVIIKKNENGAHYASTQTKETFNPDLTGRKWQPWVFLEKSNFVDKMALRQKFKAIYNHRKKTFVLAENFRKYKSISNAKFVITHPKSNDNTTTGNLKYTFRLKHS